MKSIKPNLEEQLRILTKQRDAYTDAINEIDDYFEYTNESQQDKDFVYDVLDRLSTNLAIIM